MNTFRITTLLSCLLLIAGSIFLSSNSFSPDEEKKQVEAAILDYVNGLYLADSSLIHRSVHPELSKSGYYFKGKDKTYSGKLDMSFEQLVKLSASWNKDGKSANEQSPKEITVYEVLDKTASGKLVAEWGIDYFHLAKLDGKWYIMNVLWQSPPQ